ncbi:hypothetical protein [Microvirga vignae]|uniref:hypothetical protein n=1 Tax=Microvirga vignae TaxID=1225564 RepID=UPI000699457C|nr:hypothetical protein [Microvirga vignae]
MRKLLVALGAFAVGALLIPDDAAAQRGFRGGAVRSGIGLGGGRMIIPPGRIGGFGGGAIAARPGGFYRGAVGVGGYRGAAIGYPGIGYRYRPAFREYGYRYPYDGGYYRPYYRRNYGGAVAAGLIGGLALGALSSPYYYGYPYSYGYSYGYPYYGVSAAAGNECYWERRRVIDPWGRVVIRPVQVCYY